MHTRKLFIGMMFVVVCLLLAIVGRAQDVQEKPSKFQERVDAVLGEVEAREASIRARAMALMAADELKKAEEKRNKTEDKFLRKARAEQDKMDKEAAKREKKLSESMASVHLVGCDPDTVTLNPAIGTAYGLKHTHLAENMEVITVVNEGSSPIMIRSGTWGVLVENLCSGGSLKLTFATSNDYPQVNDTLTVITQSLGAGTFSQTMTVSLYRQSYVSYGARQINTRTWSVR